MTADIVRIKLILLEQQVSLKRLNVINRYNDYTSVAKYIFVHTILALSTA